MLTRDVAERLLYREARLLDENRLEEWLDLFTADATYWVPITGEDPDWEPSIVYDNRDRMEERVFRLLHTPAHAQNPPSRTQHDLTNVEVVPNEHGGDDRAVVRCNLTLHELRIGDPSQVGLADQRLLAGRCTYLVRRVDREWRIAHKRVDLLDRELPQYNLTFII